MKDFLNIVVYLIPSILAIVTVNDYFNRASSKRKMVIVGILVFVGFGAGIWKDKISENEMLVKETVAQRQQDFRDSIADVKNQQDINAVINTFTQGFGKYQLKIDDLLPVISDIRIQSTSVGIILSYQLNKPVEELSVVFGPNPFDNTFDESFGSGRLELPKRLGGNSIKIDFTKLGLGSKVTLNILTKNPFYSFPAIEHNHVINSVTDVMGFLVTEEGKQILTEDGKKISGESKKQ